jgi:hypothetical protein
VATKIEELRQRAGGADLFTGCAAGASRIVKGACLPSSGLWHGVTLHVPGG